MGSSLNITKLSLLGSALEAPYHDLMLWPQLAKKLGFL